MNNREMLKILNDINYSEEEISELEKKSLDSKNKFAENIYKVKNEEIVRKIVFHELNKKVNGNLETDEVIKYKGIFFISLFEKTLRLYPIIVPGIEVPIYFGLFVTNKRIFIYKLTGIYTIIEYEQIKDIKNIDYIKDTREDFNTISLIFKDKVNIDLRPINKENEELLLEIIKYLKEEKNLEVRKEKVKGFWERGAIEGVIGVIGQCLFIVIIFIIIGAIFYFFRYLGILKL